MKLLPFVGNRSPSGFLVSARSVGFVGVYLTMKMPLEHQRAQINAESAPFSPAWRVQRAVNRSLLIRTNGRKLRKFVAQIFNLLYRRLSVGSSSELSSSQPNRFQ